MAWAYSWTLPAAQLAALLRAQEPSLAQTILERNLGLSTFESLVEQPPIRFISVARPPDQFHFDDRFDPHEWECGRAFGETMELRWRRRGGEFAVLLIAESSLTLPDDAQAEIELPEPVSLHRDDELIKMILWGEWQNPKLEPELPPNPARHWWYEERIPQFLGYPWVDNDGHLAIEVARYRASAPSDTEPFPGDFVYRFVRLVAVSIPPAAAPTEEEREELEEGNEDD